MRSPDSSGQHPMLAWTRALATLALAALPVSCGDGPAEPPPGVPTTLSVSQSSLTFTAVGQTEQLAAEVRDNYGAVVIGPIVAWESSRPTTVTVDGNGLVTAVTAGTATVTAKFGALSTRVQVTVAQEPRAIEKLSGDGQHGFIAEPLPLPVSVRVLDANGHFAALVRVQFNVTSGGGAVSPASSLTDEAGVARTTWTLGKTSEHTLTATAGAVAAEFEATGERAPLSIVTDSLARARLELSYRVRLQAKGGTASGYVWGLGEESSLPGGLQLDSTGLIQGVPAQSGVVEFEARVVDSEGEEAVGSLTLRVCEAPLGLAMGEVRVQAPSELLGCGFYLQAPEAGAYYRIALAGIDPAVSDPDDDDHEAFIMPVALHIEADTATARTAAMVAVRAAPAGVSAARAGSGTLAPGEWQEVLEIERANDSLHYEIRSQERELFARLDAEGRLNVLPDRSPEVAREVARDAEPSPVLRTFSLYDRSRDPPRRCEVHRTLGTRLVTENDFIAVYEDTLATDGISVANADRILDFYADYGAPVIERYFGGVSDVNADGRVVVLVDPTLAGIRAFVWSGDHTLPLESCAASNEMELVHMSAGAFAQLDNDRYWAFGALVHELKHVSSQYKRVRHSLGVSGRDGGFFHPTWIEEGTAEIAKEMSSRLAWEAEGGPAARALVTGDMLEAGIRDAGSAVYGIARGTIARAARAFTADPNAITFTPRDGGTVYGSGWHFHRFLRDWYGGAGASRADDEAFVATLNDSLTAEGIRGIESVTGETIENLLVQHAIAMSVAGSGDRLAEGVPRISSYDFPQVSELVTPNPSGHYPWPVTSTGLDPTPVPSANFRVSRPYRGELAASGVRFHDFRADRAGAGATFLVELEEERFDVRVIVARIPDPAGS